MVGLPGLDACDVQPHFLLQGIHDVAYTRTEIKDAIPVTKEPVPLPVPYEMPISFVVDCPVLCRVGFQGHNALMLRVRDREKVSTSAIVTPVYSMVGRLKCERRSCTTHGTGFYTRLHSIPFCYANAAQGAGVVGETALLFPVDGWRKERTWFEPAQCATAIVARYRQPTLPLSGGRERATRTVDDPLISPDPSSVVTFSPKARLSANRFHSLVLPPVR